MTYNPTVQNRSADYMMMAAETNANMMNKLGSDIGGALANIGNMYGEIEGRKAKGRAFKKTLEVLGPSIGMTTDKLKMAFGDLKNDMDYFHASEMLMPALPSMINATLGGARLQQSSAAPMQRTAATAYGRAAAGQATVPPQSFNNINFGIVD